MNLKGVSFELSKMKMKIGLMKEGSSEENHLIFIVSLLLIYIEHLIFLIHYSEKSNSDLQILEEQIINLVSKKSIMKESYYSLFNQITKTLKDDFEDVKKNYRLEERLMIIKNSKSENIKTNKEYLDVILVNINEVLLKIPDLNSNLRNLFVDFKDEDNEYKKVYNYQRIIDSYKFYLENNNLNDPFVYQNYHKDIPYNQELFSYLYNKKESEKYPNL